LNTSKLIVIYSIRFLLVYSKFLLQSNVLLTTFRCGNSRCVAWSQPW